MQTNIKSTVTPFVSLRFSNATDVFLYPLMLNFTTLDNCTRIGNSYQEHQSMESLLRYLAYL